MTVSWWRTGLWIGGHIAVVFAAIVLVPMAGPSSGVLALWLVAATVGLWLVSPHIKVKRTAPVLQPDSAELETWSTDELIARHDEGQQYENEGSPATLSGAALLAIEDELRRRRVQRCDCGAPLPDGIHPTYCPERS